MGNKLNLRDTIKRETNASVDHYVEIVREERFFCSILLHDLLSSEQRMKNFLEKCEVPENFLEPSNKFLAYIEYAMARDLWSRLDNKSKMMFICDWIDLPQDLVKLDITKEDNIVKFNRELVKDNPAKRQINSPCKWSIEKINNLFKGKKQNIELACKLKWAFNIKPDIVVECGKDYVVCVEAKMESRESRYPTTKKDKEILGLFSMTQIEVQKFLMQDLLGFKQAKHVFLVPILKCATSGKITWDVAFDGIQAKSITVRMALKHLNNI